MAFLYSLKLYGSNWSKALKFFLYYIVIWGLCFALLLPCFYAFKDIIISNYNAAHLSQAFMGVFKGSLGAGISNLIGTSYTTLIEIFDANVGLAVYGLIVLFIVLPFLINVGKYTYAEMLYSYMTSKSKIGFFNALVKGLGRSLIFALCKVLYNLVFFALIIVSVYGIGMVRDEFFVTYLLPLVEFVVLVLLFTLNNLTTLGWMPALIVFNCNVFSAYRKGLKAVSRHFWTTLGTTILYFTLFWLLIMIFGLYTMVVLVPLLTSLLCVYKMVMFFSSQGMRFYFTSTNILTPKKLEEVDNINKTAYIL